jgi:hypothetical protein
MALFFLNVLHELFESVRLIIGQLDLLLAFSMKC